MSEYGFETLLMIGIVKALSKHGLLTDDELKECINKIEREGQ